MAKFKYKIAAQCPRCGKKYLDATNIKWLNDYIKPQFCHDCTRYSRFFGMANKNRIYTQKKITTNLPLTVSRGLSPKEKTDFDRDCNLMGWKFRQALQAAV